jgi:hypothetical protein
MRNILPYHDLFTLVILLPTEVNKHKIVAHHSPDLSVIVGSQFTAAPADALPDAPGVVRIFDVLAVSDSLPEKSCDIPLSPRHPDFAHQRYWRVPAKPEVVLAMFMARIGYGMKHNGGEEIKHARRIAAMLLMNNTGIDIQIRLPRKHTSEDHPNDEPPRKLTRLGSSSKSAKDAVVEKGKSRSKAKSQPRTVKSPNPGPCRRKTVRLKI